MGKSEIVKKTKKTNKVIVLPGATEIYQSNRVTNARLNKGHTNIQNRLIIAVIKNLQEAIRKSMDGEDYTQLGLFKEDETTIRVGVRLSEITDPKQYKEVIEAANGLMDMKLDLKSPMGKDYISITNLVTRMEVPIKENGRSVLYMHMYKDVAKNLIDVDRVNGKPSQYTKYLYEVAMNASSKYTSKIYMLISSWKEKGGFQMKLEEFRKKLGIADNEYKEYAQFKRRVLLPAQNELEGKADCWFNCKANDFEVREGRSVVTLCFKVIKPELQQHLETLVEGVRNLLRTHFRFQPMHMVRLQYIFANFSQERYEKMVNKIVDLTERIKEMKGKDGQINDVASYAVTSLVKMFPVELK